MCVCVCGGGGGGVCMCVCVNVVRECDCVCMCVCPRDAWQMGNTIMYLHVRPVRKLVKNACQSCGSMNILFIYIHV